MSKKTVVVRDVDEETYLKFRATAVKRRINLGGALTESMRETLEKNGEETKHTLQDLAKINGIITTKAKVRWRRKLTKHFMEERNDFS